VRLWGAMLEVMVNGHAQLVPAGSTVADVVRRWRDCPDGIAVARNGEVVVHSAWTGTEVAAGDHLEILTAAAGG